MLDHMVLLFFKIFWGNYHFSIVVAPFQNPTNSVRVGFLSINQIMSLSYQNPLLISYVSQNRSLNPFWGLDGPVWSAPVCLSCLIFHFMCPSSESSVSHRAHQALSQCRHFHGYASFHLECRPPDSLPGNSLILQDSACTSSFWKVSPDPLYWIRFLLCALLE